MVRSVSIKTQARRLAFFSAILKILNRRGSPVELVSKQLQSLLIQNSRDLIYPYDSGLIRGSTTGKISNSLKIYLDAGVQLGLFDNFSALFLPSKLGIVLNQFGPKNGLYPLNEVEKLFFEFVILKRDADIFSTILEMIHKEPAKRLKDYLHDFQEEYISRLDKKIEISKGVNRNKSAEVLRRVKSWKSAKRYSEDIVPPRLNWMIDLGMMNKSTLSDEKFKLSESGSTFSENLIPISYLPNELDTWIYTSFFTRDSEQGILYFWEDINHDQKSELMENLLKTCWNEFRTLNLPRIPLEASFLFICLSLRVQHQVIANFIDLEQFIEMHPKIGDLQYGLRKSAREYESYIIIK